MKSLYNFSSYEELNKLVESVLYIKNWLIHDDKLPNRLDAITPSERYQILKDKATELNISFNDTEIVTWLDTLNILYYVFKAIEDQELKKTIKILQEYCIPYSNKRVDYLLVRENKILILEFSFNKLGYAFQYEPKLQQAIGYKELLSNNLPKDIDIGTYTCILEAEKNKDGRFIFKDGFFPNHHKIKDLALYIEKFFKKYKDYAFTALKMID